MWFGFELPYLVIPSTLHDPFDVLQVHVDERLFKLLIELLEKEWAVLPNGLRDLLLLVKVHDHVLVHELFEALPVFFWVHCRYQVLFYALDSRFVESLASFCEVKLCQVVDDANVIHVAAAGGKVTVPVTSSLLLHVVS